MIWKLSSREVQSIFWGTVPFGCELKILHFCLKANEWLFSKLCEISFTGRRIMNWKIHSYWTVFLFYLQITKNLYLHQKITFLISSEKYMIPAWHLFSPQRKSQDLAMHDINCSYFPKVSPLRHCSSTNWSITIINWLILLPCLLEQSNIKTKF